MIQRTDGAAPAVLDPPRLETAGDSGGPMTADGGADYGVDSPKMVVALGGLGAAFVVVAVVFAVTQGIGSALGPIIAAVLLGVAAAYMVRSSRVVKPAVWDRRLDGLALTGKERALDLGCGRGLVTVGLAHRLPRGSVVGLDIWRPTDQTGNSRANAEANLAIEGVADRVELVDGSMTDLPFGDGEFDLVTASLSLHCLPLAKERGAAMQELMRVTKRGGRVVILDVGKTFEYQAWLNDAGWEDVVRGRGVYAHYPAVRFVSARKPRR